MGKEHTQGRPFFQPPTTLQPLFHTQTSPPSSRPPSAPGARQHPILRRAPGRARPDPRGRGPSTARCPRSEASHAAGLPASLGTARPRLRPPGPASPPARPRRSPRAPAAPEDAARSPRGRSPRRGRLLAPPRTAAGAPRAPRPGDASARLPSAGLTHAGGLGAGLSRRLTRGRAWEPGGLGGPSGWCRSLCGGPRGSFGDPRELSPSGGPRGNKNAFCSKTLI